MLCENVKSYLANSKGLPFFYVVGDEDYKEILSEFTQSGVIIDRVSDFCPKDDKYPDIDDIIDHFRTLDMDYRQNKHVLIGLGEYLALRGAEITEKVLRRLKNTTLGTARVIILLRCVTPQINNLATEDGRIAEQKRLLVGENAISSLNVTCVKYFAQDNVALGIKNLLHDMEDCCGGKKYVKSDLDFSNSLIPVTYIHTAFSAVKQVASNSELAENMGTEAQWDRFFQELSKSEGSLDALFLKYGYEDEYEEDIYEKCAGFEFKNWIFFVFLKQKCRENQDTLIRKIREGKYKPNPVRRVEIPKETKGEFRKLGVPTVVDRVIQQAIAQELSPVYEERFSENSFGFRPKRGAHDALRQCQKNVNDGYVYVVDMDLEKFFDTVCQSKLIEVLSRTIKDKNYAQWYCSGKIGRGELACSDPATVSGVRLNKYLVEMADMLLDYSTIEYSKNLLKRRTLKWLEDLKDQLSTPTNNEAVEKAIADLERKRGNLIDLYTDGLITKTEFKSKSVELDNELEKQKALLDAQEVNPDIKAIEDTIT